MHGCSGEHAFETLAVENLHREMTDKIFGERLGATARFRPTPAEPAV